MGKNKTPSTKKKDKGGRAVAKSKEEQEAAEAETAAQVREIEERLQGFSSEMKQVEGKIKHCMLEAKRAELTEKELVPLSDDSKIYRQVGKMFILQPKPVLTRSLKAQCAVKSVESAQLKQALGKIQEKVKGEADALRELIGPEKMKKLFDQNQNETAGVDLPGQSTGDAMMPLFGKAKKEDAKPAGDAGKSEKPGSVEV
mmetsp:Transcript_97709/g.174065  ORF Transcript_97709/g.174065 Transcript_97709/m.174065 type:complete len:200 (+) Transcript_97709:96-695(+)|eukprot:CAMPEP_0197623076 /NCGR_PEP_ID=MMETSP1338-20131121/3152_1 /TAXON_ID=43686 ORGANISM="Pelagodinium beii, Strain RCC1491" /NCGR_SAMPLE_ID=MMETSP1338 /ASSEMBLY_ACC=CAM_ASM_000754 /LENGTH=199 /DNA_ID=CAMNT_0043192921 /DNA_START=70 /DNA_END=669 /DNA_ORIENTATION=+